MKLTLRAAFLLVLFLPIGAGMLGGCASLEPLPRFRTSSTSFAPDQLPLAERSTKDLVDPTTVASYSSIKEQAQHRNSIPASSEEVGRLVINQSSASLRMPVDQLGLDVEEVEDELSEGDDVEAEDVSVVANTALDKVIAATAASPEQAGSEDNPALNRPELMREIINLLGIDYHYGGMDATRGLDCSAFAGTVYNRALGMRLPRSSVEQFRVGDPVKRVELKIGDLVFFKTRRRRAAVSHVGIYVGENLFAHASTKYGVIISSLEHPYYNRTYVGARRLVNPDLTALQAKP